MKQIITAKLKLITRSRTGSEVYGIFSTDSKGKAYKGGNGCRKRGGDCRRANSGGIYCTDADYLTDELSDELEQ